MSETDLCPTCKQPMPRDAMTADPHRSAKLKCEFCEKQAGFIIDRRAVCYEHRDRAK